MATPPTPPGEPVPPPPDAAAPAAPPPADPGPGECPRCGSPYEPGQEYCLECGLRLPLTRGFFAAQLLPAMGGLWRRHLRWYPGDWVWPVVFALIVAVAAATVVILTTRNEHKGSGTITATTPTAPTGTAPTGTTPTGTEPTGTTPTGTSPTETAPTETAPTETTPTETTPTGPIKWPAGKSGFTVILASVAHSDGLPSARKTAQKALDAGLTDVGVLNSDNYSSLRSGYYVIFSGVFDTLDEAKTNLTTAQGTFPQAYTRRVSP